QGQTDRLAGRRVPELDRGVVAHRSELRALGMKGDGTDPFGMATQGENLSCRIDLPERDVAVGAGQKSAGCVPAQATQGELKGMEREQFLTLEDVADQDRAIVGGSADEPAPGVEGNAADAAGDAGEAVPQLPVGGLPNEDFAGVYPVAAAGNKETAIGTEGQGPGRVGATIQNMKLLASLGVEDFHGPVVAR